MKAPISWYGGKQRMIPNLLPLLPPCNTYVEPFCGAASLLFAKAPSPVEVINDTNRHLLTFYRVLKTPGQREALIERLNATPYSRACYEEAAKILNSNKPEQEVAVAWAIFLKTNWSFANKIGGGGALTTVASNRNFIRTRFSQPFHQAIV